jgi:hypothetical protein
MATRRKPTIKKTKYWEVSPSFPIMNHSSSNCNLKLAKISPPFHNRYYKPSAINTPPWSKKDPECTSLKPSATLPPCKSEKNSATHLSIVNVNSFQVPSFTASWRQKQVCPEIQRKTRSTCPLRPKRARTHTHTHNAYDTRFGSVQCQTRQQQQAAILPPTFHEPREFS